MPLCAPSSRPDFGAAAGLPLAPRGLLPTDRPDPGPLLAAGLLLATGLPLASPLLAAAVLLLAVPLLTAAAGLLLAPLLLAAARLLLPEGLPLLLGWPPLGLLLRCSVSRDEGLASLPGCARPLLLAGLATGDASLRGAAAGRLSGSW